MQEQSCAITEVRYPAQTTDNNDPPTGQRVHVALAPEEVSSDPAGTGSSGK